MAKRKFSLRPTSLILPVLAAAGLGFALYSVLWRPAEAVSAPASAPPATPAQGAIAGIGVVEPRSEFLNLGVELPGVVRQVFVQVGDTVVKGQPLFALDQREVDAEIATLSAAIASADISAADAKAAYELIRSVDDPRAVSKDEVDRRRFAADLAAARTGELRAQLAAAQTRKRRLTVTAPIDGRILALNARPGEYALAGALPEPLVRMGDTGRLHVRVEVDEENAGKLTATAKAQGSFRGASADRVSLSFVRFEPYVQPKQNLAVAGQRVDTRVVQVLYALPEGSDAAFVGRQMDVFIEAGK
ncbi:hypothetical protein ABAC460_14330 [Asticcacaulis sp. AC460]|uniref:efflux RND transporter periplasmic adaptor subunit n=1 Tax=Asticcacaulis sp. AC460 TaxID=1282360 RepID=UPI0003C3ACF9|nr:efflux RND transporter periplasmic adaptor subunit [Asticcacaulis sp. AC460]ESQ88954.1 hypothetical protein ABAC460_14330 [Asticcacaulis sp. AC460]